MLHAITAIGWMTRTKDTSSKELLDEGNSSVHLHLTSFDHNDSNESSEPFQLKPGSELIQVMSM